MLYYWITQNIDSLNSTLNQIGCAILNLVHFSFCGGGNGRGFSGHAPTPTNTTKNAYLAFRLYLKVKQSS